MKKIKIINIDNNEVIKEFTTTKRSIGTITDEVIQNIQSVFGSRAWIQGAIKMFGDAQNNCQIGGNLWWVVYGCDGRLQFEIL